MPILFKKSKQLESGIESYLDFVIRGGLLFKEGIKYYLTEDRKAFQEHLDDLDDLESEADTLRRDIENMLYEHTLIPEHRGDVLGIIENTDEVINVTAESLMQFSVEQPSFPEKYHQQIRNLADASVSASDEIVSAIRAYFKEVSRVRDSINKVLFYEKEADKIADKIKRAIFQSDEIPELAEKMHIRDFIVKIEGISDTAEVVSDRLGIAAIKLSI
ncbi:MAG: DUF47 family protein [Candidatus Marinimicrobia bacterium]|nr:DUF47 family protein [Candidatus Neomarinimicrobiota bacterium]MCF7828478.1 DUF47 family protein [Candidatus Neomarinimicrobiota bacterium]MCF7881968.1 DUF47 family protein [Candidatus Neomarinimicrobiota bacterium]